MNVVLKTTAKLTALVGLLMLSLPSLANEKAAATESLSPLTYEPTLENRRDPNRYCAGCHKFDSNGEQSGGEFHFGKFHGRHLQEKIRITGKALLASVVMAISRKITVAA